jgi:hypothetical protein
MHDGSISIAPENSLIEGLSSDSPVRPFNYGVSHNGIEWQTWPGELSDPIAWSAQFLDPAQNFHFNPAPISSAEMPQYGPVEGNT